jgi:hypothetical protein
VLKRPIPVLTVRIDRIVPHQSQAEGQKAQRQLCVAQGSEGGALGSEEKAAERVCGRRGAECGLIDRLDRHEPGGRELAYGGPIGTKSGGSNHSNPQSCMKAVL